MNTKGKRPVDGPKIRCAVINLVEQALVGVGQFQKKPHPVDPQIGIRLGHDVIAQSGLILQMILLGERHILVGKIRGFVMKLNTRQHIQFLE